MTPPGVPAKRLALNLTLAAVGTVGAYRGTYELLTQQARIARRVIPKPTSRPYDGDGLYRPGAVLADPWRPGMTCDVHMMIFGDSLAAGLGAESPGELPGVLLARGLAEESGQNVRLSIKAIVGATSKGLAGQVEAMQIARGEPDIAVILIGGNDITARNSIGPSARRVGEVVESLRRSGSHVVVGTCPDLGIVEPVPQPLRSVMAALSRRLAGAQAVQVRKAGGVPVSLAEALSPELLKRGGSFFSPDRFHPNSAGYELAAGLLLPAVCDTLGVWDEATEGQDRDDDEVGAHADLTPDESRSSVVARLTHRLTHFVRTHEDADARTAESSLHNEEVDGDPENTGHAREAADTLRRRSRSLRRDHSSRDPGDT